MKHLAKRPRYSDMTPERNPGKRAVIRSDKRGLKQVLKKDMERAVADNQPLPPTTGDHHEGAYDYDADWGGAYHTDDQDDLGLAA